MPLIKKTDSQEKQEIKITLRKEILDTIDRYNEWAGVSSRNSFLEQAAMVVFQKDSEWKKHIKALQKEGHAADDNTP